ncbi:putative ribonuclease H-like domain-containing protein [Tanacetum coccineum]
MNPVSVQLIQMLNKGSELAGCKKKCGKLFKSRFGGNDESKKNSEYMSKATVLKASLYSNSEGYSKRLWTGVDSLSFDDLYNNLIVFKSDVKGSTASSSSKQNVAFILEKTSSTNDVSTAYDVSNSSEGMHAALPPPMTRIYIPSGPDKEIDDSQFTYGPKQSTPSESDARSMADFTNLEPVVNVSPIPSSRINSIHPSTLILGGPQSAVDATQEELLQFKIQKVWILVDLPYEKKAIGTKWVYRNKKDERGVVVRNKARIEAIKIFLAFASYMGFIVYQMDVKSALLYGKIDEEIYVSQPPGFIDPKYPQKVYKVVKALYGLHQAPRAWYATLSTFLLKNGYRRGTIDKTLFIKKDKQDIILVQVYVHDIIFGSTKKYWCDEIEALMQSRFHMSSMGELTFFLGLQVKQNENGIFISLDKYVAEILKKFDFVSVKTASTPIETQKPLVKDKEASDVDVHLYRSMIGSLMYLTAFRPDIMFAVCACSRFLVTPKSSHLSVVKRIFRYLKGKPKLGLWYPRVSSFDMESYSDSDYAGANLDRKSTKEGCQFLGMAGDLFIGKCKKGKVHTFYCILCWYKLPPEDEGCPFKKPTEAHQHPPHTPHTSEALVDPQSNPSPRPSPSITIPDSIPESSGGNHGGQSSSDKSLSGNEGDMTLQSVYDLCISLCTQVSDQAKEIQHLKAQIMKLKKQAKPVITHHRGRKSAKADPSVHKDLLFDEIPKDTLDYMETEDAQNVGRTRDIVDEEKTNAEDVLSTKDVLSTAQHVSTNGTKNVSTDKEKASTDRPIVSTNESKFSTDKEKDNTDRTDEGTDDQTEEGRATQTTQTPTSIIFGDDETIAQVLLNMSQAKAVSKEKEKGVEFKDIEETERPRPTSTRSLLTLKPLLKIDPKDKGKKKIEEEEESESESDGIPEAEKKFKQLASDEEMARKVQEEWEGEEERKRLAEEEATNDALIRNYDDIKARIEADRLLAEKLQEEEREQFTIEERAKFIHDTIAAQRKFLAQQRSEAIRNRPPTKNQLRNQMMTYLKHVGNFKHSDLKTKKFEEIQALYEKIKRSDEDFISIGSAEDERLIKKMNEKGIDSSKNEMVKEEDKEEESTRKRKLGTRKKMKSRKRRFRQNTSEDDSEKENDELRLCLTIAPDEDKEVDYEILDKKYPIIEWKTEYLGTKPQVDKAKHLEEINQNVVIRSNGQKRYFSTLMRVLSIFDRDDLNAVYQLVMDRYQDEIPEGFDRVLWGDLMIMFNPDDEDKFWNSQQDWNVVSWKLHGSSGVHTLMTEAGLVIHMLVEKKYPLRKKVLLQMLELKLESEEDSTMALELIRFVKKLVAELEPEDSDGDEEDL